MDRRERLRRLGQGHDRSVVAGLELARCAVVVVWAGSLLVGFVLVIGVTTAVLR